MYDLADVRFTKEGRLYMSVVVLDNLHSLGSDLILLIVCLFQALQKNDLVWS